MQNVSMVEFLKGLLESLGKPAKKKEEPPPKTIKKPEWLLYAESQKGVKEPDPIIQEYHKAARFNGDHDDSWCSSFLCWCFERAGIESPRSPGARDWLKWGKKLDKPQFGCVVVFWRDNPDGWTGHVGLYVGENANNILLLSGNSNNMVREAWYPKNRILGYRWP